MRNARERTAPPTRGRAPGTNDNGWIMGGEGRRMAVVQAPGSCDIGIIIHGGGWRSAVENYVYMATFITVFWTKCEVPKNQCVVDGNL